MNKHERITGADRTIAEISLREVVIGAALIFGLGAAAAVADMIAEPPAIEVARMKMESQEARK